MSILEETTITLDEAARTLPGVNGKPLNFSTVWRWILKGVNSLPNAKGQCRRIKLEAARLGGRWITSREAITRFSEALSAPPADAGEVGTPAARKSRNAAARAKATKMGI